MIAAEKRKCAIEDCWHTAVGKSKYCATHKKIAREKWLDKIAERKRKSASASNAKPKPAPKSAKVKRKDKTALIAKYKRIYELCVEAADRKAKAAELTPMAAVLHSNQLDDRSPVVKVWVCDSGARGNVLIKLPLTHSFVKWLVKNDFAFKSEQESGAIVYRYHTPTRSPLDASYEYLSAAASGFVETLVKHLPTLRNRVRVWRRED